VKAPETQAEEIEESVKMEETATPVEDEPDQWAPATRKRGRRRKEEENEEQIDGCGLVFFRSRIL